MSRLIVDYRRAEHEALYVIRATLYSIRSLRCYIRSQCNDFNSGLATTRLHLRCWQMTRATLFCGNTFFQQYVGICQYVTMFIGLCLFVTQNKISSSSSSPWLVVLNGPGNPRPPTKQSTYMTATSASRTR